MGYNLYSSMHTTQKFYFYNSCMRPQSHNISSRMQISNLYSIHVEANLLMAPLYFYFQNHFFLHPRYFKHTTINIRYRILDYLFHTNLRTFRITVNGMAANSNSTNDKQIVQTEDRIFLFREISFSSQDLDNF